MQSLRAKLEEREAELNAEIVELKARLADAEMRAENLSALAWSFEERLCIAEETVDELRQRACER